MRPRAPSLPRGSFVSYAETLTSIEQAATAQSFDVAHARVQSVIRNGAPSRVKLLEINAPEQVELRA